MKVGNSDTTVGQGLDIGTTNAIEVDESSYIRRHQSSSITDGETTLPSAPLSGINNIVVDTTQPVVTGVYRVNGDGNRTRMRTGGREF